MNKSAIEKFAIWARTKLISEIKYKAGLLGVTEKGIAAPLPQSAKDMQIFDVGTKNYTEVTGVAISQRAALVTEIKSRERSTDYKTAFEAVVEEVAYTWFNRLIAIRFMEVNDYLPSRVRVLSSENPAKNEPDFVTAPFDTDLSFSPEEQDMVLRFKDENKLDELFQMLFIKQCNKLHDILPELFETTNDYTELLLTISFTDKDGVVYHLTHDIEEKDFDVEKEGQVEIIGWLYQYYNSELKDETFAQLKKNVKVTKERIPAATQVFTPDWIVRYMVENSLGRLWVEGHPNNSLKANWKYFLEEAEQEESVRVELEKIRTEFSSLGPEEIKVLDPCMGSGHILVYAFDVLMQIYESNGYTQRDAARSIITNNLYGLDIDKRAYQLAYFAVMMKARQYNRRILTDKNLQINLFVVDDSSALTTTAMDYIANGDKKLRSDLQSIKDDLANAKEYGSLVNVSPVDFVAIDQRMEEIKTEPISMDSLYAQNELPLLLRQAKVMAQKYHVVVTNPPYMGSGNMNSKLAEYIKNRFPDSKSDASTAFMERSLQLCSDIGLMAMINIPVWMFLSSYEALRESLLSNNTILNMVHPGRGIFGSDFGTTSFVIAKQYIEHYTGTYRRLFEKQGDVASIEERERAFLLGMGNFSAQQENFSKMPGSPVAYWVSEKMLRAFEIGIPLNKIAPAKQGIKTADKDRFLRLWFEVGIHRTSLLPDTQRKWFPCNKGGAFRKWYGNNEYVVDWENNGYNICNFRDETGKLKSRPQNLQYMLREGITYTNISISSFGVRYSPAGFIYDAAGSGIYPNDNSKLRYILGFLASKVAATITKITSPSMSFEVGQIGTLPFIYQHSLLLDNLVNSSINLSKQDWDAFETSWDFTCHPLVRLHMAGAYAWGEKPPACKISSVYKAWELECEGRFNQLKTNEEELNRIFIDIYGLQDELTSEVEDRDVTVRKADLKRDIRSLISYAVGCMFGRYSLDGDGLFYAGGEWDKSKYKTFLPDEDNVIPICDDGYFQDDIVGRFVQWVETVYGQDTLEENLKFIAGALGNKGNSSVEIIRNYFLNDFYADHCKIYQKRPIYWLFDSGKQNGFKALVYMHRWNADTIGNLRVEYLHKMQRVYEREIDRMQEIIETGKDNREIAAATKRKDKLQKQLKETKDYDTKVGHLALARIDIDLDDGVKVNYEKVQTGTDGQKLEILAKLK